MRRLEITNGAVGRITPDKRIVPEDERAARKSYAQALPSGAI